MLENVAVQGGNAERIQVPGYRVTSKTGTAQVADPVNGGYKNGVVLHQHGGLRAGGRSPVRRRGHPR